MTPINWCVKDWRQLLFDAYQQVREGLERCSVLEEESSAYLKSILDAVRAAG